MWITIMVGIDICSHSSVHWISLISYSGIENSELSNLYSSLSYLKIFYSITFVKGFTAPVGR